MSLLQISDDEARGIDSQLEDMLDWTATRRDEAEQLAMDATRLLSCTKDRLDKLSTQGFFKRCWGKFNGDTEAAKNANTQDLVQMQKLSMRYLNMLQERELLLAHSMLTLKNNLLSLAVKEEETRNLITMLAERTLGRFEKLEHRVDQLEISTNLQGWLLSLGEMDYEEKFPTEYMRLFKIINDFYSIKNDNWNYRDLMFMRAAMRTVQINPKKKISLRNFIDGLIDEIQTTEVGITSYKKMITACAPQYIDDYHIFTMRNISSPVFTAIHTLSSCYEEIQDMAETLQKEENMSASDALRTLLKHTIQRQNVDLDYEFPLAETAIEILGCVRLTEKLAFAQHENKMEKISSEKRIEEVRTAEIDDENSENKNNTQNIQKVNVNTAFFGEWKITTLPKRPGKADIVYADGKFWLFQVYDTALYISSTNDFNFWNHEHSILEVNNPYLTLYAMNINNSLVVLAGYDLYVSEDMKNFQKISLKQEIYGQPINYRTVYYDNNLWFVTGSYAYEFTYTEQGLIFDSQKEAICWRNILYFGEELTNLHLYDFSSEFNDFASYFSTTYEKYNNGILINVLLDIGDFYIENSKEGYALLAFSENGNTWYSFSLGNSIHFRGRVLYYDGELYLHNIDSLYKIDMYNGTLEYFCSIGDYHTWVDERGFVMQKDSNMKTLSMTNDFKRWVRLSYPQELEDSSTFLDTGNYIIMVDYSKHKMAYCEIG